MGTVNAPEGLTDAHETTLFDCGEETLNNWLKKRALKNQVQGASRTFVICDQQQVIGFYALASGSVEQLEAPKSMTRNMPDPIPVVLLGRLAIDKHYQCKKLGAALLKDALLRTLSISQQIGVKALLVHALSDEAKRFYQQYGFQVSPMDSMTLLLPVKAIQAHL